MNTLPPLMPPDQLIRYLLHRIDNTLMCERGAEMRGDGSLRSLSGDRQPSNKEMM